MKGPGQGQSEQTELACREVHQRLRLSFRRRRIICGGNEKQKRKRKEKKRKEKKKTSEE